MDWKWDTLTMGELIKEDKKELPVYISVTDAEFITIDAIELKYDDEGQPYLNLKADLTKKKLAAIIAAHSNKEKDNVR